MNNFVVRTEDGPWTVSQLKTPNKGMCLDDIKSLWVLKGTETADTIAGHFIHIYSTYLTEDWPLPND